MGPYYQTHHRLRVGTQRHLPRVGCCLRTRPHTKWEDVSRSEMAEFKYESCREDQEYHLSGLTENAFAITHEKWGTIRITSSLNATENKKYWSGGQPNNSSPSLPHRVVHLDPFVSVCSKLCEYLSLVAGSGDVAHPSSQKLAADLVEELEMYHRVWQLMCERRSKNACTRRAKEICELCFESNTTAQTYIEARIVQLLERERNEQNITVTALLDEMREKSFQRTFKGLSKKQKQLFLAEKVVTKRTRFPLPDDDDMKMILEMRMYNEDPNMIKLREQAQQTIDTGNRADRLAELVEILLGGGSKALNLFKKSLMDRFAAEAKAQDCSQQVPQNASSPLQPVTEETIKAAAEAMLPSLFNCHLDPKINPVLSGLVILDRAGGIGVHAEMRLVASLRPPRPDGSLARSDHGDIGISKPCCMFCWAVIFGPFKAWVHTRNDTSSSCANGILHSAFCDSDIVEKLMKHFNVSACSACEKQFIALKDKCEWRKQV